MDQDIPGREADPGHSRLRLALGAASLFLFIIGLKRTFRMDEAQEGVEVGGASAHELTPAEQPGDARG